MTGLVLVVEVGRRRATLWRWFVDSQSENMSLGIPKWQKICWKRVSDVSRALCNPFRKTRGW